MTVQLATTMRATSAAVDGRRTAVLAAAVLLAVVDVLAAHDDDDAFNTRRRHRGRDKEIEVDFARLVAKLESETPPPSLT